MQISHGGGPGGKSPTPEQMARWRRRMAVPENEFPSAVGLSVLLGRSGEAAVGITKVEVYSTGFQFTLAVRVRRLRPELARGGLFALISPLNHRGIEVPLPERLLLGLEYANGRRASTLHDIRTQGPTTVIDDEELVLAQQGGGGGDLTVDLAFWVSPLPPPGPMTFVLSWPSFGIPEAGTVLDGAPIREAAEFSQPLWPPEPAAEPPALPPLPRPSSGWFADPPD